MICDDTGMLDAALVLRSFLPARGADVAAGRRRHHEHVETGTRSASAKALAVAGRADRRAISIIAANATPRSPMDLSPLPTGRRGRDADGRQTPRANPMACSPWRTRLSHRGDAFGAGVPAGKAASRALPDVPDVARILREPGATTRPPPPRPPQPLAATGKPVCEPHDSTGEPGTVGRGGQEAR